MAEGRPRSFKSFVCPNCGALYEIVKVEAGPGTTLQEVSCVSCGGPLPAREDRFILKYLYYEKPLAFKNGAPIGSPSQLLAGASRWSRSM
jgi:predicted RNA-binding Zn-ribbon protein involved in translation (DUF1610 family)